MKKVILFMLVISCTIITTLANSSLANELIVFTEFSSTVLTASIGSVTNLAPNLWKWSPPSTIPTPLYYLSLGSDRYYWIEPEDNTKGNRVILYMNSFAIESDVDVTGHSPQWIGYPDGTILTSQLWIEDVNHNYHVFDAQFFDKGDAGTAVPEPGILILLGISMMGIAGLRRWWK